MQATCSPRNTICGMCLWHRTALRFLSITRTVENPMTSDDEGFPVGFLPLFSFPGLLSLLPFLDDILPPSGRFLESRLTSLSMSMTSASATGEDFTFFRRLKGFKCMLTLSLIPIIFRKDSVLVESARLFFALFEEKSQT